MIDNLDYYKNLLHIVKSELVKFTRESDAICNAISFEYGVKTVYYSDNMKFLNFNHLIYGNNYMFVHKLHGCCIKIPKKVNLKILKKLIDKTILKYSLKHQETYYK